MDKSTCRFIGEGVQFISRFLRSFVHSVLMKSKRLAKHEKETQLIAYKGFVKLTRKRAGASAWAIYLSDW
jgi:hypothetical protein